MAWRNEMEVKTIEVINANNVRYPQRSRQTRPLSSFVRFARKIHFTSAADAPSPSDFVCHLSRFIGRAYPIGESKKGCLFCVYSFYKTEHLLRTASCRHLRGRCRWKRRKGIINYYNVLLCIFIPYRQNLAFALFCHFPRRGQQWRRKMSQNNKKGTSAAEVKWLLRT